MSEVPPTQPDPTPDPIPEPTPAPEPIPAPGPMSNPPGGMMGSGPSQDEKTQAMLVWLLSIVAGFIPALIFYLISNDKPFVKRNAAKCLGFMIMLVIGYAIAFALTFVVIGAFLFPVLWIFSLVIFIMAGMAANRGEDYQIPLVGPMIDKMFKF